MSEAAPIMWRMATLTITRTDVFPEGTAIAAYVDAKRSRSDLLSDSTSDAPLGATAATATISSGTADLTGLADGTSYIVAGSVGGVYRRLRYRTTETSTGLAASALIPTWRSRRTALGLH